MKKMFIIIATLVTIVNVNASDLQKITFDLIARNEGFRSNVYLCSAGKETIGYGFTSKLYTSKKYMSKAEADKILMTYVDSCLRSVEQLKLNVKLTDNQKAVMADMIYHFGSGAIHNANDLIKAINSGNSSNVKAQLMRWVKQKKIVNGKVTYVTVSGLVNRQARLCQMWDK